ncbi:hypothetical protein [Sulfurimonas autotrophica]|uniref:Uncharacterized protein n=1 Tax=Sulfurimonas autotrophica (strain ATCC BAA-671 / DSM 16294 / JCM 11897 / OK10) TaxID=563040 RepID=E0UQN6_SULAO|nr:hypothetical protein [Sulfurimonas autotrophica]ADN09908.1 hypothetical protein Saut_1864 [Sulfurimonas autotrophica DSM 16294]
MTKNKIKELLSITMIIFSLFLFATPSVDTSFFDASSEKVLDLENETEQEHDEEKKEFTLFNTFSFYRLFTCKQKPVYHVCLQSYHNNLSLFKPPILHS